MKECQFCKAPVVQRRNEANTVYEKRKYCQQACSIKGRRLDPNSGFKFTDEKAVIKRAERLASGKPVNSVLDPDTVRSIRELSRELGFTAREIALMKGLRKATVDSVLSGKTWSHIN